jgi:hypothetical protein
MHVVDEQDTTSVDEGSTTLSKRPDHLIVLHHHVV